jgi:hypothetical protein
VESKEGKSDGDGITFESILLKSAIFLKKKSLLVD